MRTSAPTSIDGIEKYLGSGMIRGIGPVYARKLVKAFGEKVFDIIEAEPARLREVTGIGQVRAKRITDAWAEQKIVREIMVFLHSHGVGTARAVRIYKTYGTDAVQVMTKDPYRLARDIRGIGFKTADAIAMQLGIETTAMIRIRAGISYALTEAMDEGHCGLPNWRTAPSSPTRSARRPVPFSVGSIGPNRPSPSGYCVWRTASCPGPTSILSASHASRRPSAKTISATAVTRAAQHHEKRASIRIGRNVLTREGGVAREGGQGPAARTAQHSPVRPPGPASVPQPEEATVTHSVPNLHAAQTVIVGVDTHKHMHVAVAIDNRGLRLGAHSFGAVEMMRQLKVARDSAVKARTTAMSTLKQILVNAPPVLREPLQALTDRAFVTRCTGLRLGPLDTPVACGKHTLRSLARRWLTLADEITTHDRHLARLTTETSPTLREGFAVGANTAAAMLIIFGDNPERIRSEAAFAKLCGACPIPASSGMTTGRHRLYRGGQRQANAALHRAVVVRMRYHQPTVDYVIRRRADGRTKRDIIRCLKRFLAREIYQRVMTDFRNRQDVGNAA